MTIFFAKLEPFFSFFIMAGANFLFPSTLGKVETHTLGWSVIWDFTVESNSLGNSTSSG